MTNSHTPGPWIVGISVDESSGWPVFRLRELADINPDGAEVQANAKLIAASPDLLEAAKLGLAMFDYFEEEAGGNLTSTFEQG